MASSEARASGQVEIAWSHPEGPVIQRVYLKPAPPFPNNEHCPLLVYKNTESITKDQDKKRILVSNGWKDPWVWGVYEYQHYHTNTWEALLCISGSATVQFGGPEGPVLPVEIGDLVLIPPGVAHVQKEKIGEFALFGTYPKDAPEVDEFRSEPTQEHLDNIKNCPLPNSDPLFGRNAPWRRMEALF